MHRLTHSILGIMLIVTTVGALGQILLKIGMSRADKAPTLIGIVKIMLTNPIVLFGLVLFALNTVLYLRVLQQHPLSLVYPMIAFSYVVVTFLAWAFMGERVPLLRLLGLLTITAGVLLMAASAKAADKKTALTAPSADALLVPDAPLAAADETNPAPPEPVTGPKA
jgi:drug/metabolite transporter (DMT)-like permease